MPNTVVKLTNAESTWLEAAREDRKLLINMKAHLQRCAFFLLSFGSRFKVQVAASPLSLLGRCPEVAFKSPVTPTIRGKESSHMYGVRSFGSVLTYSGFGGHT